MLAYLCQIYRRGGRLPHPEATPTVRSDAEAVSGAATGTGALPDVLVTTGGNAGRVGTRIWGGPGGKLIVSLGTVGFGGGTPCRCCRAL